MTQTKCRNRKWLDENFEDLLVADGLDWAIIGVVERFGMETVTLYDLEKVIRVFMKRDGMSHEEAEEHFYYNVIGGWHGEKTPAFAILAPK